MNLTEHVGAFLELQRGGCKNCSAVAHTECAAERELRSARGRKASQVGMVAPMGRNNSRFKARTANRPPSLPVQLLKKHQIMVRDYASRVPRNGWRRSDVWPPDNAPAKHRAPAKTRTLRITH